MLCKYSAIVNATANITIAKAEVLGSEGHWQFKMSDESLQIMFEDKEQISASTVTFVCTPNLKNSTLIVPSISDQAVSQVVINKVAKFNSFPFRTFK